MGCRYSQRVDLVTFFFFLLHRKQLHTCCHQLCQMLTKIQKAEEGEMLFAE